MSVPAPPTELPAPTAEPWQRLSIRVVWVDVAVSIISLIPGVAAVWLFGVEPSLDVLWPLAIVAGAGILGAAGDIIRWAFTSYRITARDIERRTGLFVRRHRSLHRDRVRSVDTSAKLRHRLAGLRVVTIGAGQQTATGESALVLDALSRADALALRERLLDDPPASAPASAPAPAPQIDDHGGDRIAADSEEARTEVLATFTPWWVVYNMFSIWAYLMAAGLSWGAFWLASSFGVDLFGLVSGLVYWEALGWAGIALVALIVAGIVGAVGLGVTFLVGYWHFELARVRGSSTSFLRTRRGLLSTREVNRDESRMRGMSIGEPLLWRWMGMADTNVITTGLSVWDTAEPTAILPRGPVSVARRVARYVFGAADPMAAPLERHPKAALRRRLWWATAMSLVAPLGLAVPALAGAVPGWLPMASLGLWPLALAAAVIAYRALGNAITGEYLVVRSGLFSRTTSALRIDAVSTIAIRQSLLQRRLGLRTVAAMTAAGWSAYEASDMRTSDALEFADASAPGVLDDFIERSPRKGLAERG